MNIKNGVKTNVNKMLDEFAKIISSTGKFSYIRNGLKESFILGYINGLLKREVIDRHKILNCIILKLTFLANEDIVESFLLEEMKMPVVNDETIEIFSVFNVLSFTFDENHHIYHRAVLNYQKASKEIGFLLANSKDEEIEKIGVGVFFGDQVAERMAGRKIFERYLNFLSKEMRKLEREIEDFMNRQTWIFEINRDLSRKR